MYFKPPDTVKEILSLHLFRLSVSISSTGECITLGQPTGIRHNFFSSGKLSPSPFTVILIKVTLLTLDPNTFWWGPVQQTWETPNTLLKVDGTFIEWMITRLQQEKGVWLKLKGSWTLWVIVSVGNLIFILGMNFFGSIWRWNNKDEDKIYSKVI